MKKLLLFLPLLLVFSCSVQKRKYQNGYYVDWHSKKNKDTHTTVKAEKPSVKKDAEEIRTSDIKETKELYASGSTDLAGIKTKKPLTFLAQPDDSCDILVYKDGSEIKGKVSEVGVSEVKYKRCDAPDGPTYISKKTELFMIKYSNGTKEVIKSETPPQPSPVTQQRPRSTYSPQSYNRQIHPLALSSLFTGILSVVLLYAIALFASAFGVGVFILPFLAGLSALISGKTALNRIREQPEVWKGKGPARAGFIMGMIIVGIYLVIATVLVLALLLL